MEINTEKTKRDSKTQQEPRFALCVFPCVREKQNEERTKDEEKTKASMY